MSQVLSVEEVKEIHPAAAAEIVAQAVIVERDRLVGIMSVAAEVPPGNEQLINAAIADARYTGADVFMVAFPSGPQQTGASLSEGQLAAHREATSDWNSQPETRVRFNNKRTDYIAFRMAAAQLEDGRRDPNQSVTL